MSVCTCHANLYATMKMYLRAESLRVLDRPLLFTETPRVLALREPVKERLDLLLLLAFRDAVLVRNLEESRCYLGQPLWLDHRDLVHVFL